jgi:hypothetical protein
LAYLDLLEIELAKLPLEKLLFFEDLDLGFMVYILRPSPKLLPYQVICHIFSDILLLVFYLQEI